ncbi:MAG: cobO [Myxococcaceae bacterium]|nr:cobO [Myxococcaceae bacterium]
MDARFACAADPAGGERRMEREMDQNAAHKERMRALQDQQDRELLSKHIKRGVIVVNTGDGKGKSTAAFGVAIRAAGHGQRVGLVQFIKGNWKTGEQNAVQRFPEITHVVAGDGFTWVTQDRDKDIASARVGWERARQMLEQSRGEEPAFDVLVLDELNAAVSFGYLAVGEVVEVLQHKPAALSIVITGRDAKPELLAIADTVTEMRSVKHAFEAGIKARRGIEF